MTNNVWKNVFVIGVFFSLAFLYVHNKQRQDLPIAQQLSNLDISDCGGGSNPNYYSCRRSSLLRGCGEICDTSLIGSPSKFFNFVKKDVDCHGLWANEAIDESVSTDLWPPPEYPPPEFLEDFKQGGRVEIVQDP
jgi:hypothetical protein